MSEPAHSGRPAADTEACGEDATASAALAELQRIRHSIDNIDSALVHVLAERFKHTQRVGELKAASGMPASDPEREARQIERLRQLALDADLDPEFAEKFLQFIVTEVIRHHRRIASAQGEGVEASTVAPGEDATA